MDETQNELERRFREGVKELAAAEKWSDLKIIHSILQDTKDQLEPTITSEMAQAAIKTFFGEGYCCEARAN